MNVVTIALASSMAEFEQERDKLDQRIEGLRELLEKRKIHVNFELWRKSVKWDLNGQAEFNERIRKSHFFFAIIGKRAGEYTQQEIDVAEQQFRDGGSAQPRIKVFFQDVTPDEILPENRLPLYTLKSWATDAGYFVPFSKFEKIYGTIIAELIQNGAILQEWKKKCNTSLKARWTIRANRKKIDKISKVGITQNSETELMLLHTENMMLSEVWHLEWKTFYEYVRFLNRRGHNEEAIETGERLEKGYAQDMNADARAALKKLLGDCRMSQGQHEVAEPYYRAALELYRKLAEENEKKFRYEAAETCAKLAEIMIQTFRYKAAERLYRESLEYYLGDAEKYAREIGLSCHSLQKLMGQNRNAEWDILRRAEQTALYCVAQHIKGQMGAVQQNLHYWMETFPCIDTATELMEQTRAIVKELIHNQADKYEEILSDTYRTVGLRLKRHNQLEDSETLHRKSYEIRQRLFDKSPSTFGLPLAQSCNGLAEILSKTRRPLESAHYCRKSLEILQRLMGLQVSDNFEQFLAQYCSNLAILLQEAEQFEESEYYYRKASKIQQKLANQNPAAFEPHLAVIYYNWAILSFSMGRMDEATFYYRKALTIQEKLVENSPKVLPDLAKSYHGLACLMADENQAEETERYYKKALNIQRKLVKENPYAYEPDLANFAYNYGLFLKNVKQDNATARVHFDEAIALWEHYPRFEARLNFAIDARNGCSDFYG